MLRPAFTQQLAAYLLAGESVNLHAPHGRGRRQTLEDLLTLLAGVQVQKIDLKREQDMWNDWLKETLTLSGQVIVPSNQQELDALIRLLIAKGVFSQEEWRAEKKKVKPSSLI
ncbi:MAG: hypothetical protein Q9M75_03945 [Ghiorsea sp.]|nr:hypothetical protein [Ghiorsea sp.]